MSGRTIPTKAPQKLVSFMETKIDFERMQEEMDNGWHFISLVRNGCYFTGIMEQVEQNIRVIGDDIRVFIPPVKKIRVKY